MFFFMARVLLIKVATGKLQKYHRHCCSNTREDGEVFFVNIKCEIGGDLETRFGKIMLS